MYCTIPRTELSIVEWAFRGNYYSMRFPITQTIAEFCSGQNPLNHSCCVAYNLKKNFFSLFCVQRVQILRHLLLSFLSFEKYIYALLKRTY
jgi:hypothetical protein